MDGSTSPRGRRALVVERGWKFHRLAAQCQARAYRQVVPERNVILRSAQNARAGAEAGETVGRVAAGGGS